MGVRMLWEALKERADKLRHSADEMTSQADSRRATLPGLALAAHEQREGGIKAFSDAVDEIDRLISEARRAQFAAAALDEKAEQTRIADREFELNARVSEMSDARAAYDHAINEMDRALKDLEDAFRVLHDARTDYVGTLRRAEFGDAAVSLQRRSSRFLQCALWANAPTLASALGIERRFVHHARSLSDTATLLPDARPKEKAQ